MYKKVFGLILGLNEGKEGIQDLFLGVANVATRPGALSMARQVHQMYTDVQFLHLFGQALIVHGMFAQAMKDKDSRHRVLC